MGVETPIPPSMIYAAAPEGAPPRRISDWIHMRKYLTALRCPLRALRRRTVSNQRFSWFGCELPFMCVSAEPKKLLWRNHLIVIMTLLGALPPSLWHPPIAIVPYYLYAIVEKFPVQVMQRHRNTPPPPMGAGLA